MTSVTCGLIILKHLILPELERGFMMNLQIGLQIRFGLCGGLIWKPLNNEPLSYEEVADVCSRLKLGVSGVSIDYEHIRYAGPSLWKLLFQLYQQFFKNFSISKSLKTGIILPLFNGKGAKANNNDNYNQVISLRN